MRVTMDWQVPLPDVTDTRRAVATALGDVAEQCLEEANRTIPLEEGILSDSGFVEVDEAGLQAQVAYSTAYAVVQHEDPSLTHDAGRRDHWLEQTVIENQAAYEAYLAAAATKG